MNLFRVTKQTLFEDVFAHLLTVDTKITTPIGQQSIQCAHDECFA